MGQEFFLAGPGEQWKYALHTLDYQGLDCKAQHSTSRNLCSRSNYFAKVNKYTEPLLFWCKVKDLPLLGVSLDLVEPVWGLSTRLEDGMATIQRTIKIHISI